MFNAARILLTGGIFGKIIGVGRELLLAALFGTTVPVAAYRIAQTATLIPVNFFLSDSLNAGFIPLYTRYSKEDPGKAKVLFDVLFLFLLALSVVISSFLFWGSPLWVKTLAPGLDRTALQVAAGFTRIMAIGVPFYIIGYLLSYLEMGNEVYTLTSLRASLQSVGLITGTVIAFVKHQPEFLAWGFTGAYIIFSIWGFIRLWNKGILNFDFSRFLHEVKSILVVFGKTMLPLLSLPFMLQGSVAVERAVASLMGLQVVASLDYAKFITDTGTLFLAMPLGLAGLSALSRLTQEEVQASLKKIIRLMLMITIPIAIFIAINSQLIIHIIYTRGAFDLQSEKTTSMILFGLAIGFWGQIVGYILIKSLNALMRNKEVLRFMAISLGLNAIVNVSLYKFIGPLALGLGASIYGIVLFVLTIRALKLTAEIHFYLLDLGIGGLLYIPFGLLFAGTGWLGFVIAFAKFIVFWTGYFCCVPRLRELMFATLQQIRKIKK